MRETTVQIAAFCTELGLGTMRVGGEVRPPESAQQQGAGCRRRHPGWVGGGGGPGPESIHTHRESETPPKSCIERCVLPGPCGNLESSVPQASHAIMLTGGIWIVYLATATLALFGFEKVAPTRELAAQIHREAGEFNQFNPSG